MNLVGLNILAGGVVYFRGLWTEPQAGKGLEVSERSFRGPR